MLDNLVLTTTADRGILVILSEANADLVVSNKQLIEQIDKAWSTMEKLTKELTGGQTPTANGGT